MRGWFILLACALAVLAGAHPISASYVDLRVGEKGVEARIEVQNSDLAHEIPHPTNAAIAQLIASRFHLNGITPVVKSVTPVPDQGAVRLAVRYDWSRPPARLAIDCDLFPYHPQQTLVDVYQDGGLKGELTFDGRTTRREFALGSQQSLAAVVGQFLGQGVEHIFTGPDHVLFIVGLLLLGGSLKQLLKIVTAFTVAHSVTLCLAAFNVLSPPARLIEPMIALSIVFVGVHDLLALKKPSSRDPRIWFAFGFGFIHGFGFANALRELSLPPQALAASLFSFNLGVEVGQACIVLAVAPVLALLRTKSVAASRWVASGGSVAVVLMGAVWFAQRV
jgi:hydrogenase/urease accessory protein HupE